MFTTRVNIKPRSQLQQHQIYKNQIKNSLRKPPRAREQKQNLNVN